MAALTFATMLTAVRTRLGNPSTDGFYTDAQIGDFVNEALQIISTEADWPWQQATTTFATVSGTATYDPTAASGWMKTRGLCINGYNAMNQRSLIEVREFATTITGTPEFYCLENELLNLRPVPNAVFTVIHDYLKIEPELSSTAEPLMPAQFRWSIVEFATYLARLRAGDETGASAAKAAYDVWINKMADHRRRTTSPRRVRVRPGSAL